MPFYPQPEDLLITLWHGSDRTWDGFPEVRNCRRNSCEYGPGLYLTTHLDTARKYAKGGGSLVAMTLRNPRLLNDQRVSLDEAMAFVNNCPNLRQRTAIVDGLKKSEARWNNGTVMLNNVVTWCVNHDALGGASGPALAAWLVGQGVDAQIVSKSGQEDWLVVFNPRIIVDNRKVPSASIDVLTADRPQVLQQLETARRQAERAVLLAAAVTDPSVSTDTRPRVRL